MLNLVVQLQSEPSAFACIVCVDLPNTSTSLDDSGWDNRSIDYNPAPIFSSKPTLVGWYVRVVLYAVLSSARCKRFYWYLWAKYLSSYFYRTLAPESNHVIQSMSHDQPELLVIIWWHRRFMVSYGESAAKKNQSSWNWPFGTRFARLSVLFSMIRIDPNPRRRTGILFVAAIFALVGVLLTAQVHWICADKTTWRKRPVPRCPLSTQFVVCQLVCQSIILRHLHIFYSGDFTHTADIVADSILMVIPIKLFHDILEKGLRRRLMLIFSASFMTTVVSLVHKGYIIVHGDFKDLIAAGVEVGKYPQHCWPCKLNFMT